MPIVVQERVKKLEIISFNKFFISTITFQERLTNVCVVKDSNNEYTEQNFVQEEEENHSNKTITVHDHRIALPFLHTFSLSIANNSLDWID